MTNDMIELGRRAAAGPLSLDAAGYRYLLADPACPQLAPWSPAQETE